MATYKTPDVYVQERSIFPPSVAEVATAIPAFLGRTELAIDSKQQSLVDVPTRITSMVEYESLFGGPKSESFLVDENGLLVSGDDAAAYDNSKNLPDFILYQALQHFFANGGGACYVVTLGTYDDYDLVAEADAFNSALDAVADIDEVTLLVMPDAVRLGTTNYYTLGQNAIAQCAKLQDRFAVLDVIDSFDDSLANKAGRADIDTFRNAIGTNDLKYGSAYHPYLTTVYPREYTDTSVMVKVGDAAPVSLESLFGQPVYATVQTALAENYLVLPPSAAIVGVYAQVDGSRGVWKAPANVSLNSVLMPRRSIDNDAQADMNVDSTAGKSVNAIRAFTGKGTLVWGARTLAGNDNEWRYVSVRRLFNTVEESIKKSTYFAVFESNTAFTWLKIKTMIESYLNGLWQQGALFGESADQAYFVNVGLGQTMTEDDINNGIMNVEIGIAAVRPAEFIILTFSHKSIES